MGAGGEQGRRAHMAEKPVLAAPWQRHRVRPGSRRHLHQGTTRSTTVTPGHAASVTKGGDSQRQLGTGEAMAAVTICGGAGSRHLQGRPVLMPRGCCMGSLLPRRFFLVPARADPCTRSLQRQGCCRGPCTQTGQGGLVEILTQGARDFPLSRSMSSRIPSARPRQESGSQMWGGF